MKLLHITATHLKPDGGVPVVLKNLVTEQNKIEDFEAKVISVVAPVDKMNSPYFDYVSLEQLEAYMINYLPNVVILHSFYYLEYNRVIKVLGKLNIPYYIEPHGSFGRAALKKSKVKKMIANRTIFRKQIENAYGFVFLNNEEKEDSQYRTDKDIIIPNGIFEIDVKEKRLKRKENKFYFIGRYDINHKGLDYLLKALSILEKEQYQICVAMWGKGDKKAEKYIENIVNNFKYVSIEFEESIYGKVKNDMLEQLGPMLLTSRYEGFPMTILEAWAYGNPCIVTRGTNVYEEVISNDLGWGVELNAQSIANVIKIANEDYAKYKSEYIYRCKSYVKKHYLWGNIALESRQIYMNILSKD